jgi:hypothetical protein
MTAALAIVASTLLAAARTIVRADAAAIRAVARR